VFFGNERYGAADARKNREGPFGGRVGGFFWRILVFLRCFLVLGSDFLLITVEK
jgi:hypothetical protein